MDLNRVIGERDFEAVSVDADGARAMFRDMIRARRFDERALALQRRGWMSGYPPFQGQEASQIGAAHAMAEADWLVPTYRSNAMQIARGVPMSDIFLFRRGRPEFHSDHDIPVFPQAVPIATQIPHAAGIGMAARQTDADHGVVCYLGDGATSEGDFHEGMNFAGVFEAPVVFLCENNNWAISVPRAKQTAADTIAQKATAYGFDGVQVDGNDPLAVYETMQEALATAKDDMPVLVESLTYRQGAHTTSDDPSRYRDIEGELPEWRTRDPIERFEEYLRDQAIIDDDFVETVREDADEEVDAEADRAESVEPAEQDEIFDYVYETLTPGLREQREWLRSFTADHDIQELDH
ncbi:MAG: pyruvate dehydrogenase (acetyl-transferring) E1 component subunit alpha [Halobacteriales archaeon]|nr:pyruvate dehydrogenase (acetyl-transferring) E1 component subunit alpha [Halobacteriales archaeon]